MDVITQILIIDSRRVIDLAGIDLITGSVGAAGGGNCISSHTHAITADKIRRTERGGHDGILGIKGNRNYLRSLRQLDRGRKSKVHRHMVYAAIWLANVYVRVDVRRKSIPRNEVIAQSG